MQEAIERVMRAYTLMVTLSPEGEAEARERVARHLAGMDGDTKALAMEGLRFLRRPDRPANRG